MEREEQLFRRLERRIVAEIVRMGETAVAQLEADGADLVAAAPAGEVAEPTRVDDLGVVVEQHEDLAGRLAGHLVVDGGVRERLLVPPQHAGVH